MITHYLTDAALVYAKTGDDENGLPVYDVVATSIKVALSSNIRRFVSGDRIVSVVTHSCLCVKNTIPIDSKVVISETGIAFRATLVEPVKTLFEYEFDSVELEEW